MKTSYYITAQFGGTLIKYYDFKKDIFVDYQASENRETENLRLAFKAFANCVATHSFLGDGVRFARELTLYQLVENENGSRASSLISIPHDLQKREENISKAIEEGLKIATKNISEANKEMDDAWMLKKAFERIK